MTTMNDAARDDELTTLITQIGLGNEAAMKRLYELTSPRLYGLALRVVRKPEWAEDVLQEAYLSVWRNALDFRNTLSPPLAWMGLIVRSRALDLLRRRAADRGHLTQELDELLQDTLEGPSPNPQDVQQASQQARALHQCLSGLEHKQRQVVSLAYLRDLSHSELAQQLSLPLGTVKTWIRRGLDQLRHCMHRFA
jgi:RNA polymerase sigma factor (sigma-70 family)